MARHIAYGSFDYLCNHIRLTPRSRGGQVIPMGWYFAKVYLLRLLADLCLDVFYRVLALLAPLVVVSDGAEFVPTVCALATPRHRSIFLSTSCSDSWP
jgi:hypothetical protein